MKKRIYSTLAMLSLLFVAAVVSVQAQTKGKVAITIPFEFQIGSQTLPAGEYRIKQLTQSSVLVQSADGESSIIAQTMARVQANVNEKAAPEKLVFNQYGNRYFLSQVWLTRGADGSALKKTGEERDAAKEQSLARGDAKARRVEITATAH